MDRNDVIATLNTLIETSRDGEEGFRACAEGVKNPQLKSFFEEKARRCAEGAAQLQGKVIELGGKPERSSSVSGAMHRAWVNIKSTITGMDDKAILAECERGENIARQAYEDALKEDLPPDVRMLVDRQYREVKANHERVREMCNATA
ncbi:MAG TPA: PA2169 family four-helix-bundle protein [Stellaceae bacterium]|nr:PA2169 family four-helix-bundle protein [Stellaceae bacterium]